MHQVVCEMLSVVGFPRTFHAVRKLVYRRSSNEPDEIAQIEMMGLKIFSHFVQQIRLDGLRTPWRGNLLRLRIKSCQIETRRRIDNADAEQLRPKQIYRRARELDVAGKHACERRPRIFARFGMLAGQDESRTHISFVALNAHDAVAGSIVVAFAIVAQNEFVHQVAVWPEEFHLAEESRLAPKIRALPFRQPQIDLVQMVLAVVTRD